MKKLLKSLSTKMFGLFSATLIRNWMSTLDYKVFYHDPTIDPALPGNNGQAIYLFWHEYILFPLYLRGHNNLAMLLSRHRDADILVRVANHMGFDTVRGSTNRGGVTAIRQLVRKSKQMNLTITPDGPRGPRRKLAPGAIFLASKLGLPLVLMGFGYKNPWRLKSWDRFAIAKPFSKARAIVSPRIHIPGNLNREEMEAHRLMVETTLNNLSNEAENWAISGKPMAGQMKLTKSIRYRGPKVQLEQTQADLQQPNLQLFRSPAENHRAGRKRSA